MLKRAYIRFMQYFTRAKARDAGLFIPSRRTFLMGAAAAVALAALPSPLKAIEGEKSALTLFNEFFDSEGPDFLPGPGQIINEAVKQTYVVCTEGSKKTYEALLRA